MIEHRLEDLAEGERGLGAEMHLVIADLAGDELLDAG